MKWHREGSVITVEMEASDFPEPVELTWDLPRGVTVRTDGDNHVIGATVVIDA